MLTQITKANFSRAQGNEFVSIHHAIDLAPFFAIQEAEREKDIAKRREPKIWMWDKVRTVNKCQQIVWQLAGAWQARRGVPIKSQKRFHEEVTRWVITLAAMFNRDGIMALRDMKIFDQDKYEKIVCKIEDGIMRISKTKPTQKIQPVLGSKVMHHFFPTIIPVFDDAWISKKVLKLESFKDFLKNNKERWLFKDYAEQTRMQEYHHYFAYCVQQICKSKKQDLDDLRDKIANLYMDVSPHSLVKKRKQGILWKLDAKLAEYCLVGATYQGKEG